MVKEILIGVGGAVVIAAIIAMIKYQQAHKEDGTVEKVFEDEINVGEVKRWFADRMKADTQKGVLFYPTKENLEKWKIGIPVQDNMIIQMVFDQESDSVVEYREITFEEMSPKLKELLDTNGGTVVIDR